MCDGHCRCLKPITEFLQVVAVKTMILPANMPGSEKREKMVGELVNLAKLHMTQERRSVRLVFVLLNLCLKSKY